MPTISKRAHEMIASPIRKYLPAAQAAAKRGIKVYALNIGQPDLPAPPAFWKEVSKWRKGVLAYAPSTGLAEAQEAWSTYFQRRGLPLAPKDVLITTGGSEAIFFSMAIACALLFFLAPTIMKYTVPGFDGEKLANTILLTRIMLFSPFILGVSGVISGVLHSFKNFLVFSFKSINFSVFSVVDCRIWVLFY